MEKHQQKFANYYIFKIICHLYLEERKVPLFVITDEEDLITKKYFKSNLVKMIDL